MRSKERHRIGRVGWLRAAVLGANDGILSTASLGLGVATSHATHSSVIIAGTAGLMAGAMSMAAGEYVSVHSQRWLRPRRRGTRRILNRVIGTGDIGVPCNRRGIARSGPRHDRQIHDVIIHSQSGNWRAKTPLQIVPAPARPIRFPWKRRIVPDNIAFHPPHAAPLQLIRQTLQCAEGRIRPLRRPVVGIFPARHARISRADQRHVSANCSLRVRRACGNHTRLDGRLRSEQCERGRRGEQLGIRCRSKQLGIVLFINQPSVQRRDRDAPVRLRRLRSS